VSDAPSTPLCFFLPQGARRDASRIKPGRLYLASSVLAIAISLCFLGVAIASFWDYSSAVPAWLILLPFSLAVGSLQYRATFRRSANAASWLGIVLIPTHGLLLLGTLMGVYDALAHSKAEIGKLFVVALLFNLLGAFGIFCGIMNVRWSRFLQDCRSHGIIVPRRPRFSLREVLVWAASLAATASLTVWLVRQVPPQSGEHATAADAWLELPDAATAVCFSRGMRGTIAYEFTIDEAGFREWAESLERSLYSRNGAMSLERIDEPYRIPRYWGFSATEGEERLATISRGYYVRWSDEVWRPKVAYDLDSQRAYYYR
jgi:hypothetical protein